MQSLCRPGLGEFHFGMIYLMTPQKLIGIRLTLIEILNAPLILTFVDFISKLFIQQYFLLMIFYLKLIEEIPQTVVFVGTIHCPYFCDCDFVKPIWADLSDLF